MRRTTSMHARWVALGSILAPHSWSWPTGAMNAPQARALREGVGNVSAPILRADLSTEFVFSLLVRWSTPSNRQVKWEGPVSDVAREGAGPRHRSPETHAIQLRPAQC